MHKSTLSDILIITALWENNLFLFDYIVRDFFIDS